MKTRKKRLLLVAGLILTALAAGMLYHPAQDVVFEVSGTEEAAEAVFLIDGEEQTRTLTMPASVSFPSVRELRWSLREVSDAGAATQTTWHVRIQTDPASRAELDYEYDSSAGGTSGVFGCPNLLGLFFRCGAAGDPDSALVQR